MSCTQSIYAHISDGCNILSLQHDSYASGPVVEVEDNSTPVLPLRAHVGRLLQAPAPCPLGL